MIRSVSGDHSKFRWYLHTLWTVNSTEYCFHFSRTISISKLMGKKRETDTMYYFIGQVQFCQHFFTFVWYTFDSESRILQRKIKQIKMNVSILCRKCFVLVVAKRGRIPTLNEKLCYFRCSFYTILLESLVQSSTLNFCARPRVHWYFLDL